MAYVGNLSCRDCGLTFTARWGSAAAADEYRCHNDHVVFVDCETGTLLLPGLEPGTTLGDVYGRCPLCRTELSAGLLPCCPVCNGRDHEIAIEGLLA